MAEDTRNVADAGKQTDPGPFLAKVISHHDKNYMGILEVQLYRESGNDEAAEGQLQQARYLSPFWGITSVDFVSDAEDNYNNTQKSYGMWFVPPDVGVTVLVTFIDGNPADGYWFACIPSKFGNQMIPAIGATTDNDASPAQKEKYATNVFLLQ